MNVKLFQICFEKRQLSIVDNLLTPFDNTENKFPELREYHNFKRLLDEGHTKDLDLWGAFGPRWQGKLRYNSQDIFNTIEKNSGYDVYLFNHARVVTALTYNVWEHGETAHPGIRIVAEEMLSRMGYDKQVAKALMTEKNTCYCSYFIATNEFWKEYLDFLTKAKDVLDSLEDGKIKDAYLSSANYERDKELNLFPFIIERLFSTFLLLNPKYKVYSKPYNYDLYNELSAEAINLLTAMNRFKTLIAISNQPLLEEQLFGCWNQIRFSLIRMYPNILRID